MYLIIRDANSRRCQGGAEGVEAGFALSGIHVVVYGVRDRSGRLVGRGWNEVGNVRLFCHHVVEAPTVELSVNS
jgi:hypothetical protein